MWKNILKIVKTYMDNPEHQEEIAKIVTMALKAVIALMAKDAKPKRMRRRKV